MPHPAMIKAMLNPGWYPHAVTDCRLIETHISWVILTGEYAYKLKKPLNLGFLDFSTLEKRHFCCVEELRLNRRLAPSIYLDLLSIGGSPEQPVYGSEPAIEYAVRMRQFDPASQLDRLLEDDQIDSSMIASFARKVASFHQQIARTDTFSQYGSPSQVWQPMLQNFIQIREHLPMLENDPQLLSVEQWSAQQYQQLDALLALRHAEGFIRECHGDMHLANMAWLDGEALIFDGIEFNPALRWIDVVSEVAFTVMDLHQHHRPDLAWRFLNNWLEYSGDFAGLPLLDLYLVYRAMVRTKIAAIRLSQLAHGQDEYANAHHELQHYLALATSFIRPHQPRLLLCHGLSGSGKTVLGMQLLEQIGGIQIRSDVERKRLFGLDPQQRGGEGLYQASATQQTYQHILTVADTLLNAGHTVLVDATFLDAAQRKPFRELTQERGIPFFILSFQASEDTLRARLAQRQGDASDANGAVLSRQIASFQPLGSEELDAVIPIATEQAKPLQHALEILANPGR